MRLELSEIDPGEQTTPGEQHLEGTKSRISQKALVYPRGTAASRHRLMAEDTPPAAIFLRAMRPRAIRSRFAPETDQRNPEDQSVHSWGMVHPLGDVGTLLSHGDGLK